MFSVFRQGHSEENKKKQEHDVLIDSIEFVDINFILNQIKDQKDALEKTCLQETVTLLDIQKCTIISAIFTRIEQTIYHAQNKLDGNKDYTKTDLIKAKYELVELCSLNVLHILSDDFSKENLNKNLKILNTQRDKWRTFSLGPVHYGVVGAAVVFAGPASLLGAIGLGLASHIGLRVSENVLGLNAETTSLKLIDSLFTRFANLSKQMAEKLEKLDPGACKDIANSIWKDELEKNNIVNPAINNKYL